MITKEKFLKTKLARALLLTIFLTKFLFLILHYCVCEESRLFGAHVVERRRNEKVEIDPTGGGGEAGWEQNRSNKLSWI